MIKKLFSSSKKADDTFATDLLNEDHNLRKKIINELAHSGFEEPRDPRRYGILGTSQDSGWTEAELRRGLEQYPDLDTVYLQAAYPDGNSDHHNLVKESILLDGLIKAKVKANILAALSCYHMYKRDNELKALDYATASVILGDPMQGPGHMVQVIAFLTEAFKRLNLSKASEAVRRVKPPYKLSDERAQDVDDTAEALCKNYPLDLNWSASLIISRLQKINLKCCKCGTKIDHFGISRYDYQKMDSLSHKEQTAFLRTIGGRCGKCGSISCAICYWENQPKNKTCPKCGEKITTFS